MSLPCQVNILSWCRIRQKETKWLGNEQGMRKVHKNHFWTRDFILLEVRFHKTEMRFQKIIQRRPVASFILFHSLASKCILVNAYFYCQTCPLRSSNHTASHSSHFFTVVSQSVTHTIIADDWST